MMQGRIILKNVVSEGYKLAASTCRALLSTHDDL